MIVAVVVLLPADERLRLFEGSCVGRMGVLLLLEVLMFLLFLLLLEVLLLLLRLATDVILNKACDWFKEGDGILKELSEWVSSVGNSCLTATVFSCTR